MGPEELPECSFPLENFGMTDLAGNLLTPSKIHNSFCSRLEYNTQNSSIPD